MLRSKTIRSVTLIFMNIITGFFINNSMAIDYKPINNMKTIIVSGGTPPSKKLLKHEITKKTIIIAADSGANCLWEYKITPNYLVGDFDSIDPKILKAWKKKNVIIEQHSPEKNLTDAELAVDKAISFGSKKIVILGALGGKRVDHLVGQLGLLDRCLKMKIPAFLKDEHQTITLIKKSTKFYGKPGQNFSIQAYGGKVKDLTITGAKYPLKNYTLKMGEGLTLSNKFKNKEVILRFKRGKLLVFTFNKGI